METLFLSFFLFCFFSWNKIIFAKTTVFIWSKGNGSIAGHVAIETEDGTYLSHYPQKTLDFNFTKSLFKTKDEDNNCFGHTANFIMELNLPYEERANVVARSIIQNQCRWKLFSQECTDAGIQVLRAGGLKIKDALIVNLPWHLRSQLLESYRKSIENPHYRLKPPDFNLICDSS